jgi:DNA-binding response OmpR family regulator
MKILIVEDDQDNLETLNMVLLDIICVISDSAKTVMEAINKISNCQYDLIILDICLNDEKSTSIPDYARKIWPNHPPSVLVLSAMHGADKIAEEIKADKFFSKPFDLNLFYNYIDMKKCFINNSFMR